MGARVEFDIDRTVRKPLPPPEECGIVISFDKRTRIAQRKSKPMQRDRLELPDITRDAVLIDTC